MSINRFIQLTALAFIATPLAGAFPAHASLGGLASAQLEKILPTLQVAPPENPPGPQNDTSARLVDDADHPWMPAAPNDMRGPCPGLNTLASHGVSCSVAVSARILIPFVIVPAPEWGCNSCSDH
jgi:hypothetical protein